ncbi:hypothetical protein F66182_5609 [Fusarium sp. NRRL 66182]|nr:hypothetical protein F66182_5609 [Fusarium sp. NRRL 66182]
MADPSQDDISAQTEPNPVQGRAPPKNSRARVRASLACAPCRSKHVKCDGSTPTCTRCQSEGKSCFYIDSRRGFRNPKKRIGMKEEALISEKDDSTEITPSPNFPDLTIPISLIGSVATDFNREPEVHRSQLDHLFDLYYSNFHVAHSWLPPMKTVTRLVEIYPEALKFLFTTVLYIGSLYSDTVNSTPLQELAYRMSAEPLPSTIWSVQALLSVAIAASGEQHEDVSAYTFSRAHDMALQLGLQDKAYADAEQNPVLAESYRRTYWALYIHGSIRAIQGYPGHWQLSTRATTELPCEEWEYEAGEIPIPVTLEEYDRMGHSREYSSWAYFIDLMRICDEYVLPPLLTVWGGASLDGIEEIANLRVESWRWRLPNRKKDLVYPDGMVDMILYHACPMGVGSHFGLGEVAGSRQSILFTCARPEPRVAAESDACVYRPPVLLQAPLRLISLFNSHIPPEKLSPSCILGLERASVPLVDALTDKQGPPVCKVKVSFLAEILGKSGKIWNKSDAVSKEIAHALKKVEGENSRPGQSQAMADGCDSTGTDEEDPLWFVSGTIGAMYGWAEPTLQSTRDEATTAEEMPWSAVPPHTFRTDMVPSGMTSGPGSSFSDFKAEDGMGHESGIPSSPLGKAKRQWL